MNEKQLINSGIVEIKENGEVFLKSNGKIINPKNNGNGYLRIYIPQIKKRFLLHRLVATAFVENPYNKPQVNHIDGNKHNNSASNLEWCTSKENAYHFHKTMNGKAIKVDNYSSNYRTGKKMIVSQYSGNEKGIYGKIVKYCYENDLTIMAFEKLCGLSNGVVSKWKSAGYPRIDNMQKIVNATGIPIQNWLE